MLNNINRKTYFGVVGLVALLLLAAAHQIAAAPAATAPITSGPVAAVEGPRGVAALVRATPSAELPTPAPTAVASPTSAPPGSLAFVAQAMLRESNELHARGIPVSATQMEQSMGPLASSSNRLASLAVGAQQGSPDLRQLVALSLSQTGLLAAQLRDEASALTPAQRVEAMRQMEVLSLAVSQAIDEVQDAGPQPRVEQRQDLQARMQHLLGAMRSIGDRYGAH